MLRDSIKNTLAASAHSPEQWHIEHPNYSDSTLHGYYDRVSREFKDIYAQYSSDYIEADVQGLYPEEPFEYTTVHLRFSDIVKTSGALEREFDNYKLITIAEKQFTYIRIGAKVKAMGNVWLVINSNNMSDGNKAVIQRCDTTWHYLDYYGNVCAEPIIIGSYMMRANDNDSQTKEVVTKGYFNVKMQYNEAVKNNLFHNARLILGSSAYRITGFSDFINEFTMDDSSVNMIQFTIRYEEPNDAIDDMDNRVAGGKTYKWEILLKGNSTLKAGETSQLTTESKRNDEEVSSTEEHPVSYKWTSSDESVLTVDESGLVTAVGEGEAFVSCSLVQNLDKSGKLFIKVAGSVADTRVSFDSTVPKALNMLEGCTIDAGYYINGIKQSDAVTFSLSGANEQAYSYEIDRNSIKIKCWGGSIEPLHITASCEEYSAEAYITLYGV